MTIPTIDALRVGCPDAYAALLTDSELRGYAITRLGSVADADDVLQEFAIAVWRNAERYQPTAPLKAWLYRVLANKVTDHKRSAARRNLAALEDWSAPPSEDFTGAVDQAADLWGSVDRLERQQRRALRACYGLNLEAPEAAALLGMTPGAVKSARHRGLEKLRETARMSE